MVRHRRVKRRDRYPAWVRVGLFVGLPLLLWVILVLGGRALLS